ncbi:hypothetical protein C9374_003612 [Naegleria lovaniensis]|uniref:Uncharacterized protein n=1 Tax=Naegleria lovaniensis TaxID=51637 RepID=A0AA88KQ37_NAELO|nr:uncharacterized protein C9374_003612 [Naegleria lovaniensis]KAG2393848.1 hypothetical protein C9374_003612 [Naegleria lovaniensis]
MQSRHGNQQPSSSRKEHAPFHEDVIQTMHPAMHQVHVEKQQPGIDNEEERAEGVVSLDENDQMRSSRRLTMSTHRSMLGSGHVESLAANEELSNTACCNSHMLLLQPPTTSGDTTHMHQGGNMPTRTIMPPQQHACEGAHFAQNWNEKIDATTNRGKEVSQQQQQLSTMKEKHQQIENDDHPESHHREFMLDNSNDQQTSSPTLTHADQSTIGSSSSTSVHQQHHHSHVTLQHAKVKVPKSSRNRSSSKTKIQQHTNTSSTLQQMHHHPSSSSEENSTPSGSGTPSPFAIVDETTRTRKKVKKHHQLMTTGETEQKPGKIKIYAFERPLMNENVNFTDNYFVLTPTITNTSNMPSSGSSGNSISSMTTSSISASSSSDEQAQQASSTNALSKPSQNLQLVQPRKRTKKSSMNEKPSSTTNPTPSTRSNEEQMSSQQAQTLNSNFNTPSNETITTLGNNNLDTPSENSQNQSSSLEAQKSALGEFLKRFLHFTSSTTNNIFTQPAQNQILQARGASSSNLSQQASTQSTSFQEPQVQQPLLQQIAPMLNVLSGLNTTNQQASTALPPALPVGGQQVDPNALISIIDSILSREMTNRSNQETMVPQSSSDSQQPTSSTFIHSPSFSHHDSNLLNSFTPSNTTTNISNLSFSNLNKGDPWEEQKISDSTLFGTALPQQGDLPQSQNFGMISSSGQPRQQEQYHNPSQQQQHAVNVVSNTQQLLMEALANFVTQQRKTQQTFPSTSHSQQLPQLLSSSTTLNPSDFPNDPVYNISFPFEQTSRQYHHNPPTLNIMDMFQLLRQAPDNDPLKRLFLQCLSIVQQQEKNK